MWTLSASLPSDFAFENEDAKFYQPHSVEQLPNGDVLLLENTPMGRLVTSYELEATHSTRGTSRAASYALILVMAMAIRIS